MCSWTENNYTSVTLLEELEERKTQSSIRSTCNVRIQEEVKATYTCAVCGVRMCPEPCFQRYHTLREYCFDDYCYNGARRLVLAMATSHALKELAVFLTVVFMLRSFHPPDIENTQLSIHRTDLIALYASSMTSKADYEVFVPNSKSYAKSKMAEIPRTKQVRIRLKYLPCIRRLSPQYDRHSKFWCPNETIR